MKITKRSLVSCLLLLSLTIESCSVERKKSVGTKNNQEVTNQPKMSSLETLPIKYNFYVENSGSVKPYFKGQNNNASVILKEFHDRISDQMSDKDTISLNYINNNFLPQKISVKQWIPQIYSKCNAQYSDLDQILESILTETNENSVNFVMSDFCFESKTGNLGMAQSEITSLFSKSMRNNPDLSIAIYKYQASFKGNYFPGRIHVDGKRPLYLWAFGPTSEIKKVANLPVLQKKDAELYLQPYKKVDHEIITKNARLTDTNHKIINVSEWNKGHNNSYKVRIDVHLDDIILPPSFLTNCDSYTCTPNDYLIEQIAPKDNGVYVFTISAITRPYPCTLKVSFNSDYPTWLEESNFDGSGLPAENQTYGIKYLVGGIIDCYKNKNKNVFDFNVNIK